MATVDDMFACEKVWRKMFACHRGGSREGCDALFMLEASVICFAAVAWFYVSCGRRVFRGS